MAYSLNRLFPHPSSNPTFMPYVCADTQLVTVDNQPTASPTPLAPPGTKVLIHETPDQRRSWEPHDVDGWYIGPAREHYRCYRVYVPTTRAERVAKTVQFFPITVLFPNYLPPKRSASGPRAHWSATQPCPCRPLCYFWRRNHDGHPSLSHNIC